MLGSVGSFAALGLCCVRSVAAASHSMHQLSSLVVIEHNQGKIAPSTLSTLTAAASISGRITALVGGQRVQAVAEAASKLQGVTKVLVADHAALERPLAEPWAQLLAALQPKVQATHILTSSSSVGKDLLPRAAALLGVQPVSDALQILDPDTFVRPIYAGNALATVKYTHPGVRMLTVRATSFTAATSQEGGSAAPIEAVPADVLDAMSAGSSEWVSEEVRQSERPELGSARVVVCGGRALKNAENFLLMERLADLLGGAVGASRAAVDAGYVPNDLQVGQTGKVVAPELYIGVGISGAIQHLAGMKDSKTIVAINTDAEAPIFQVADYGLVADLFTAVPELITELEKSAKSAKA